MKKFFHYLLLGIFGVLFLVMGLFNTTSVHFDYVFGERELPLFVVMLSCFVFGALMCLTLFGTRMIYWRLRAQSLKKQIDSRAQAEEKQRIKEDFEKTQQIS